MDIGLLVPLSAPYATPGFIRKLGVSAEEAGFFSLWVGEHVVVPSESTSDYPVSSDGAFPAAIEYGELDPYTTLTYLAGITDSLRLGACTTVPQRNPVYTAKEIANADWLSEGRVDVGIGVGWSKEEYAAVGADFSRRGARCNSYVDVMMECWGSQISAHEDEFYSLVPSLVYPKPIQKPHPPLHILGSSEASLARVARFGDGFFPLDESPDEMGELLNKLDRFLEEQGRARRDVKISVSPYEKKCDLDMVKRYQDVGVDQVILFEFVDGVEAMHRTVEKFANAIVEPARSV